MATKERAKKPADAAANAEDAYQPTAQEHTALRKFIKAREDETPLPRLRLHENNGVAEISFDHPDQTIGLALLSQGLGSTNMEFIAGVVNQLKEVVPRKGSGRENDLNFLLSTISGMKPNDQFEALLISQMVTVHVAAMRLAGSLARAESIQQQDSDERALNKLTRTFTTQLEALKRYRSGGEPKVTVQNVSVGDGGQAIVGNVTQATPEAKKLQPNDKPLALTHSREVPMPAIRAREHSVARSDVTDVKQS